MTATLPLVSVIIPMRNESNHIRPCLDSVLAQDYPADRFEVLVVDGDSDDDSLAVLATYGTRLRVLHNRHRIVPAAMNIGIRAARGEVIARVDGHTVLAPSYLGMGVDALRRTGADNVGGAMQPVGGGAMGDAIAFAMNSRFGIGAYFHFGTAECETDTVYMGMWPRRAFERIGLFDPELVRNQDDELNYRLRKLGGRIVLVPTMQSRYQNRQDLRALVKQFFQYGLWKIRVLQKHPRQMSWRHFVPPAFVLAVGVALIAALTVRGGGWFLAAVVGAYGAALAVAAATVASRQGWRHYGRVLIAFAAMHLSWGAGFVWGAMRFARRWWGEEPPPPVLRPEPAAAVAERS
ncbi:glycosyltransferase family 2 protein [Candidatus Binatia bacterium]|nr:glycosyltransferase family 2 protein [Candidatus Binatia bacterium]